ncbi:DegT/DnrJ/EryC1/StrS aminotransferase family protein [Aliiglaciecola sp. CAU 1673]|uniref:DegT/DnrJ/EryC1/StrS family aminotransferase n=1 Tax=Aliiglaciecola sp. CAU 1673 TaxID=3032595 RepID=UPI0023DA3083|nr:DegT/DnrJ/EryC1/StrS aminotransferase family protein [Aliiglaciecola sp. CAU 1673]MDF2179793.1 DegT/DnrJ/EryC1/StrS aminotransferase family protein [Aliiglaciecola sp. CAU 1673]
MLNGPFSPWPCYSDEEKQAAVAVLDSNKVNYWTGTESREFEKEFAAYCQSNYAIAVANGTLALDLAWYALSLPPGSEVIVTSRTFLASVSSIVLAGLVPVFTDVDLDSQNITAQSIEAVLSDKTRAILCVHLAGWPCDMKPIMALAESHGLYVVEDCAQAHGGQYHGKPLGSWGHISAWSFCQDKIMTTAGEGGMVTTDNKDFWSRMWSFKDHGKSYEAVYERQHPPGFRWLHESFGTNWRLTEIQAAIGRIQLQKMPQWHASRAANSHKLFDAARQCPGLRVPDIPSDVQHAYYKAYVFVRPQMLKPGWDRDRIMAAINERGVPCFSGSCSEVYLEKAFDNTPFRPKEPLKNARELGDTSLMFLVHPTLKEEEIELSCQVLSAVMQEATS